MSLWDKILALFKKPKKQYRFRINIKNPTVSWDFVEKACKHAEYLYMQYGIDIEFTSKGTQIDIYSGTHKDPIYGDIGGLSHNYKDDSKDFIEVWTWGLEKKPDVTNIRLLGEVIAHEIGHILGLGHYAGDTNIMCLSWKQPHTLLVQDQLNIIKGTKTW